MFKECNRYRRRGLPRCRVGCRVRNNGVQEFSTYLKYSTKGAEISRSPPTYRVRRGEGSIQGGEGRITTPTGIHVNQSQIKRALVVLSGCLVGVSGR